MSGHLLSTKSSGDETVAANWFGHGFMQSVELLALPWSSPARSQNIRDGELHLRGEFVGGDFGLLARIIWKLLLVSTIDLLQEFQPGSFRFS